MSYLDEAAQDMAESFKRIFITAFGHGYDFGCESKEGECKRLKAENAKLRELVRDLVTTVRGCGQDEDGYGQLPCEEVCPHWSNDGECTRLHRDQCWYEEQARKLGVEVDG